MKHADVALLVALAVIVLLLVCLWTTLVQAADEETCNRYGQQIESLILELTGDADVAQAAGYAGAIHCGVIDYPPDIQVGYDAPSVPATPSVPDTTIATKTSDSVPTPLVKKPKPAAPDPSEIAWRAACAERYKSLDPKTMTVIPSGKKKRVPCPIPRG